MRPLTFLCLDKVLWTAQARQRMYTCTPVRLILTSVKCTSPSINSIIQMAAWQLKRPDVSIVRMVHALASETSPAHHLPLAKWSPAPSSLLRLSINIDVATTTTTTLPLPPSPQSIRRPPLFPLKSPSHPIRSLKTKQSLKTLVGRCHKHSPLSTTIKFAFHISTPCRTKRLLDRVASSIGGDECYFGVLFALFRTFPCLTSVLDLFFLFLLL